MGTSSAVFTSEVTADTSEATFSYSFEVTLGSGVSYTFYSKNLEIMLCGPSTARTNLKLGSVCSADDQCAGSENDEAYCSLGLGGIGVDLTSFGIFCVGVCTAGQSAVEDVEAAVTQAASDVETVASDVVQSVSSVFSSIFLVLIQVLRCAIVEDYQASGAS